MQRHRDNQSRGRREAGPIAEPASEVDQFSQAASRTAVGHSLRKLGLDELANRTKRLPARLGENMGRTQSLTADRTWLAVLRKDLLRTLGASPKPGNSD
jgi:hypothetical protein